MRVLIIAENPGFTPSQRRHLIRRLRERLRVITVRIATRHVEIDVDAEDPPAAAAYVEQAVGRVLEVAAPEEGGGFIRYVELFNRERFWEAHGALERIWMETRDEAVRGLILLAAAFVKLQEGLPERFEHMLREALGLLRDVSCIKAEEIKAKAEKALMDKTPFKIECSTPSPPA
ncbi:DUF309 domain-containing protein [Pyrobaculum neutrophilum]|uniref:DUF309 domain-containing protein n=1 Tax=Pyrobaculum neutrophilum (strain DSM 2338 / JCM 9278 / NBRC 100436 / V24Sta) TaxID=444157 RepID=B1YAY1_PYRNV|nr:DUF309 domain-containing protein [Pyrobaculum neutrophilum]ACB40681.1 protein of unknown function DUF309 [Pyrobaculum neutrophilum V24Sta]